MRCVVNEVRGYRVFRRMPLRCSMGIVNNTLNMRVIAKQGVL